MHNTSYTREEEKKSMEKMRKREKSVDHLQCSITLEKFDYILYKCILCMYINSRQNSLQQAILKYIGNDSCFIFYELRDNTRKK